MKSKRFFSFVLVLVLMATLILPAGSPVLAAGPTTVTSWAELKSAMEAAPTDGTETDIVLGATITATDTYNLSGNKNVVISSGAGNTITCDVHIAGTGTVFYLYSGSPQLTLKNVTLDGGAPTHSSPLVDVKFGTFTMDGATITNVIGSDSFGVAVYIHTSTSMYMKNNSAVTDVVNTSAGQGAIRVDAGTLYMEDTSSVTGNQTAFGGIYNGGTVDLRGAPKISGNVYKDGTDTYICNLFLPSGCLVNVSGALTNTTPIGIATYDKPTSGSPVNITTAINTSDLSAYFISDNSNYIIQNSGSGSTQQVQLVAPNVTVISSWANLKTAVTSHLTGTTIIDISGSFSTDDATGTIDIASGQNIVLESASPNTYTITRDAAFTNNTFFNIKTGGQLTLQNITLDGNTNFSATKQIIDVSGGTFTMDTGATIEKVNGSAYGSTVGIYVESGGIMNMKTGATISSVENSGVGGTGAIYIKGTLNMPGGIVTQCRAREGAAINSDNSSIINISGGSVTGCYSDDGAILMKAGTFNLSGSPDISNNKNGGGSINRNVCLCTGQTISVTSALTNVNRIGITALFSFPSAGHPVNITTASDQDWSSKFTSDDSGYIIQNSGSGASQIVQLAGPCITGSVNLTVDAATGQVTAGATGGNTDSIGTLTYTWSGGASGTGTVKTPTLGTAATCTVTASGAEGAIQATTTVYKVAVSKSGNTGTDSAGIASAYGKVGDSVSIAYVLDNSGTASNTLTYSGASSNPATISTAGSGTSTYVIAPGDAASGTVTLTAAFAHTALPVVSGKVSGLSSNASVTVNYTVNAGGTQSTTTDAGGNYSFAVPTGANVVITPSVQLGYTKPSAITLSNIMANSVGNNLAYTVATSSFDVSLTTQTLPTGVTYASNLFTIGTDANNSTITVTGTTTTNAIAVADGVTGLTLILNGVSISSDHKSPIDLNTNTNITLRLADGTDNVLYSFGAGRFAGLRVQATGAVTIAGNTGKLTATGTSGGAGIGGASCAGGDITISGGTVIATGTVQGAGIGGEIQLPGGNITITGGTVTATGGEWSAGIGGGQLGTAGHIAISGGFVTAIGTSNGAGIGRGAGGTGSAPTLAVTGSPVIVAISKNIRPAIDVSGGSGNVINAKLDNAVSTSSITYLNTNSIALPAGYKCFAFYAPAGTAVKAYSNSNCDPAALLGSIVADPAGIIDIPVTDLSTNPTDFTAVKLYKATVTVNKDDSAWTGTTPLIQLSSLNTELRDAVSGTCTNGVYTFAGLDPAATYYVWDSANNQYTGKSVISTSATATVNYYTVQFSSSDAGTANGSAISAAYKSLPIASGTVVLGGGQLVITAVGHGASSYSYTWTVNGGPDASTSASLTLSNLGSPVNVVSQITGVGTPPTTYALTVDLGGGSGATTSGSYASGAVISINAGTKSGYTFSGWTSSGSGTFGNASSAATTFTMPGNATTITATWTPSGFGGVGGTPPANNNTIVIVDNKDYSIGTENKSDKNTTATVDQSKLTDEIAKASDRSSVIVPVSANTNVTAQLVVKNVEDMAKKDMILTVKTGSVAYNLNTSAIDTSKITASLGNADSKNIPFNVSISNSKAVVNGATVVVSPVEFTITATYNGKTTNVDTFSCFVDRTIEITADQANRITTAVVVQPDGNLRHVPTKVTVVNGKYYAVINSLTNSTYTVVWHPVEFSDVTANWVKSAVNDMGSRMIVSGVGNNKYEPDRDITRAEFAAIVVRALGLAPGTGKSTFRDVSSGAWYCGYIGTASAYGIIQGYNAATFGPNDTISREQAMTIISKAMKITGLNPKLAGSELSALLAKYSDGTAASDYAKSSIGACLKTGIITGKSSTTLAPKDFITRAEVAVIIQRLLQKSNLI